MCETEANGVDDIKRTPASKAVAHKNEQGWCNSLEGFNNVGSICSFSLFLVIGFLNSIDCKWHLSYGDHWKSTYKRDLVPRNINELV